MERLTPQIRTGPDGTRWREVLKGADVLNLPPETRVRINGRETTAGQYAGYVVAGGTPLLAAFVYLMLVELVDEPDP